MQQRNETGFFTGKSVIMLRVAVLEGIQAIRPWGLGLPLGCRVGVVAKAGSFS
jgi:hypothetical protein